MKKPWNIIVKILFWFGTVSICVVIGLIGFIYVEHEVSMISHSLVDNHLNRMGLYEDIPNFPSNKIRGYKHSRKRSRYDYTLKLNNPIGSDAIAKIDSLCKTYEGQLRWHYDEEKGLYTLFLWDIAKDYNTFLMIVPGESKVKFVYEPATRRKTEKNEDLFYGPVYGEALFNERMSATQTSK